MDKKFAPLLAAPVEEKDFDKLKFPLYASVKLDGIRVLVIDGVVVSRSLKPIRSKAVQKLFGKKEYNGLDGEILYGAWNDPEVFNKTTQAVMSTELPEGFDMNELTFVSFDVVYDDVPYEERLQELEDSGVNENEQVHILRQKLIENVQELLNFEKEVLENGYEGVMLRSPRGKYKQGRSTLKEQILMKLKRFTDAEGELIEIAEAMHNTNEAKLDALGHTERSTSKEGLVPKGMLGTAICRDLKSGDIIRVGPGKMKHSEREEVFKNPEKYLNKIVKYKYFDYGTIDAPRFAQFIGWRDEEDMSE